MYAARMANKEMSFQEKIDFLGYSDMELDEVNREGGKVAFEIVDLEQQKRDLMSGINEALKDLKQRIVILRELQSTYRKPPIAMV